MSDALQAELVQVLGATLSPETNTRRAAEEQLANLHAHNIDVGPALSVLVLPAAPSPIPAGETALRQAAALNLRQLVKAKWSPLFEFFTGYPTGPNRETEALPEPAKLTVRTNLLHALASSPSKSGRLAASYTLAAIASSDFPDQFPELLPALGQMLQPQSAPETVHGALAFLTEFVRNELDEQQVVGIGQDLLPLMERILADTQYSPFLRARTLLIFRQLLETLGMLKHTYPDIVKNAIDGFLPRWLQALTGLVSSDIASELDPSSGWEALALRNEAYKSLKHAAYFRTHFRAILPQIVEAALSALDRTLPSFENIEMVPLPQYADGNLPSAPDGEKDIFVSVAGVAASALELLGECLRFRDADPKKKKSKQTSNATESTGPKNPLFDASAPDQPTPAFRALLSQLFTYARVTQADEETWADDINAFVAADEDEAYIGPDSTSSGLLRIVTIEQLSEILASQPALTLAALGASPGEGGVVAQACARGHAKRAQGLEGWWKDEEAVLACLGSVAELVEETLEEAQGGKTLDLELIFQQVVMPNIGANVTPFLRGRAFVFSSQYASVLPANIATQFLEEAVRTIESEPSAGGADGNAGEIVTVSAIRCIKNFHRHLASEIVRPYASRIISRLGPLLSSAQEDILVLLLETVQAVVAESSQGGQQAAIVPAETYAAIVQVALNVWAGNARDPVLGSVVADLVNTMAGSKAPGVAQAVVSHTLPHLASSMTATPESDEESAPLRQSAVELTDAVLDGADAGVLAEVGAVGVVLPHLLQVLGRTEDRDILQYGFKCLTLLVRKVPDQVLGWTDPSASVPAISAILTVVARALSPDQAESGGLEVGDLLIALLRKAGNAVLPALPELLQALVRRVVDAQTASFSQSLILPFAYLMQEQAPVVLDLLESTTVEVTVANSTGAERRQISGLEALATKWVEDCETFRGFWAQRISTLALARLLESRRPVLDSVLVKGDQLADDSNIIRTRSRSKTMPHKFTQIPISAKLLKILVTEFDRASRGPPGGVGSGLGRLEAGEGIRTPDTDDEDGEWDDEDEPGHTDKGMSYLSDILGGGDIEDLDFDGMLSGGVEDAELKSDAVYQMDMKAHLASFLRGLQNVTPALPESVAASLTGDEAKRLQAALNFSG
ncbi:unnamed protein product [Tilletia controversa]|nr:unnamed protein product [Tilletia controversa]CAD6980206.1 unnamed protein product [Tilletia controversa]